jgi:hypothetical protein
MVLGRLSPTGIRAFENLVASYGNPGLPATSPEDLLAAPDFIQPLTPRIELEIKAFPSRHEMARYFTECFNAKGFRPKSDDAGLWNWLACAYFKLLLADAKDGRPGAIARWVLRDSDFRRYYRHFIAGPYFIYQAHRDDPGRAMAVLCQRPGRPGDVVEQLVSRQELITNPAIMAIATRAMVDAGPPPQQRRGAGGKGRGSARRFVAVMEQFSETWDLSAMTETELATLIPTEFGISLPSA